jgi:DNA-binding response OmpR family regulator
MMEAHKKNTIFIVDDDPDDRQLILDAFLEHNSDIDYVFIEDGTTLIKTLSDSEPDNYPSVILLDLNMPGMLGLHALKEIRDNKNYSQIPIIVLTTSTFSQDKSSAYKLGANCFFHKPHSYKELLEIAGAIIRLWFEPVVPALV